MTSSEFKDAEQIFKALDALDQINAHDAKATKVSFSELYAYATTARHFPSDALREALLTDLNLHRDLKRLISKQAIVHLPKAAAASSGNIDHREADGFSLTLKPSRANPDQIYLLIQSIDREEIPTLMFVELEDSTILRLEIDDFHEGEAQILLKNDDDIVKALRNPKSQVILR